MRLIRILLFSFFLILMSCEEKFDIYVGVHSMPVKDMNYIGDDSEFVHRHKDAPLRILAIGNSFTRNATDYMPWLVSTFGGDSICIGRLTLNGCTLEDHWVNHVKNDPVYDFYYSDNGDWTFSSTTTIDKVSQLFKWDIIVLQQESSRSGRYATYQPYLDFLVRLFREINPEVKIAWHYTWAYTADTEHWKEFKKYYGGDQEFMYTSIMDAADRASENLDIRIPSATLIKRMREEFPENEYGFSEDGTHITDAFARYALSTLWYELLVVPSTGMSGLEPSSFPTSINTDGMDKVQKIIRQLLVPYAP